MYTLAAKALKKVRSCLDLSWASPAWRATASPAGAEKIFPLFSLFEWFSPIRSLLRTEELLGR